MGALMSRSLFAARMLRGILFGLALGYLFGGGLSDAVAQPPDKPLTFNRDIRPILADKCLSCHGQDAKKREADLRMDTFEGATADLGGTRAIVPGDLDQSELWTRVTSDDEDEVMPPPSSHKTLSDDEKALLRRWILEGAAYQKHWAFEPIQKPALPTVANATQPIDAFLLERLQAESLTPQGTADKETLIRRVAFALTGLPPTVAEVDTYLADEAADAYEKMVDRYLASPRYGEEMARHWLDVARYADTHGLHLDNDRQMWAYRDWVVKAFNDNLPFDQFTTWQIAGDLLPNPTTEQLVATGFNRCNVTTSEGGAIDAEFTYRYAVERTTTVAQAWLGLTAGCAVCHDHKYDPLTTREFYSLYAFYNSAADPAMDGNINTTPPFLKLPTPEQKVTADAARAAEQAAQQWLTSLSAIESYRDPGLSADSATGKAIDELLFDDAFPPGSVTRSSSRNAINWVLDPATGTGAGRRVIRQAHATDCNDTVEFKLRPVFVPRDGQLTLQVRADAQSMPDSFSLAAHGRQTVTWKRIGDGWGRDGATEPAVQPGIWTSVAIAAADLGLQPGDRLEGITLSQKGGIIDWDVLRLTGQATPGTDPLESLLAWRKALGKNVPPELPGELHRFVQEGPDKQLTPEETTQLQQYYVALIARPFTADLATARGVWEKAREARVVAEESMIGTYIYRDTDQPRESFIMLRGQYDKPGDKVEPVVPDALPTLKAEPGKRLNRLDLARWLVSPEHPLAARVTVNRIWQQFFGVGIVKTSYDFGTRGDTPTHPELLDYLASEFMVSGWNVKQFVKSLLMTDAFRRQAFAAPEVLEKDPGNRLYARGPRFRLDAEQVRDNALFVSGLLNAEMGGPGVRPYQPPNIWEPVGYSDSNSRFYLQDHGPSLYRRSLYVYLKRTAPPPFMSNFDGPNREQVCTMRERSNTPLQALQTMNDVQHVEAARALAERTLCEGGSTPAERATYLYRVVLARRPTDDELRIVLANLDQQLALYQTASEEAQKLVDTGESTPRAIAPPAETAAWTMVANLLLNLDETLNRN
jgi:hypothetical protein